MQKDTHSYTKRDPFLHIKRPIITNSYQKKTFHEDTQQMVSLIQKDLFLYKRDPFLCKKKSIHIQKK